MIEKVLQAGTEQVNDQYVVKTLLSEVVDVGDAGCNKSQFMSGGQTGSRRLARSSGLGHNEVLCAAMAETWRISTGQGVRGSHTHSQTPCALAS